METQKLFEITYNSDQTEGRGYSKSLGYVKSIIQAHAIVDDPRWKKYCVMGVHTPGKYYDVVERNIDVYDNAEEFWDKHDTEIKKQKALAKLTAEDRQILGL